jgi:hypothetical protein
MTVGVGTEVFCDMVGWFSKPFLLKRGPQGYNRRIRKGKTGKTGWNRAFHRSRKMNSLRWDVRSVSKQAAAGVSEKLPSRKWNDLKTALSKKTFEKS